MGKVLDILVHVYVLFSMQCINLLNKSELKVYMTWLLGENGNSS